MHTTISSKSFMLYFNRTVKPCWSSLRCSAKCETYLEMQHGMKAAATSPASSRKREPNPEEWKESVAQPATVSYLRLPDPKTHSKLSPPELRGKLRTNRNSGNAHTSWVTGLILRTEFDSESETSAGWLVSCAEEKEKAATLNTLKSRLFCLLLPFIKSNWRLLNNIFQALLYWSFHFLFNYFLNCV